MILQLLFCFLINLIILSFKKCNSLSIHFYNIIYKLINYLYKNLILVLKLRHKLEIIILYFLCDVKYIGHVVFCNTFLIFE